MTGGLRVRIVLLGAVASVALWAVAAPAQGAGLSPLVADCNAHTRLTRSYTAAELRNALATMPADIAEYSNCHDVIQRALLASLGKLKGSGGSGSGGGSFLPTWLLIVLIALALGGVGAGVQALRLRSQGP